MPIGPGYADSLQMLAQYAQRPGFDAQVGLSLLGMIEQNKASAIAQRQAHMQQLNEVISGAALQGQPYETTQMLAQGLPGPMGPAGDAMMAGYYPTGAANELAQTAAGAVTGAVTGAPPPPPAQANTSPMYTPDPTAQLQAQQSQYQMAANDAALQGQPAPAIPYAGATAADMQAQLEPLWEQLVVKATKYAHAGVSRDEFVNIAMNGYPELATADIGTFQRIIATAFAKATT